MTDTTQKSYFGLTERGILKMRSFIHKDTLNPHKYKQELYNYVDYILANDNYSLYHALPRIDDNNPNIIKAVLSLYDFTYHNSLNDVAIKGCKIKPKNVCAPTFMMNLIGNVFSLIKNPKNDTLKTILEREKENNSKLVQEPPSIRSQNKEFVEIFSNILTPENEAFFNFNDVVFRYIDVYFRHFDSPYKFDGLTYTILNTNNQADLRETMFVYLDVAFNIISYLYDNYKTEKAVITPWPQKRRRVRNRKSPLNYKSLKGGKERTKKYRKHKNRKTVKKLGHKK